MPYARRSIPRAKIAAGITAILAALGFAGSAKAATVTATKVAPHTFRLASTPCTFGFCGYGWRGYGPDSNRLGFTLGSEQVITRTFAPAIYTVTVAVGGRCSATSQRQCPTTGYAIIDAR